MKKIIFFMLLLAAFSAYSNENVTKDSDTIIKKETTATNLQQLDVKELDTEELLLKNQNLESSSIEISGENFKEGEDKIIVKQSSSISLEEELAQGVEKKSFFGRIADFFRGK